MKFLTFHTKITRKEHRIVKIMLSVEEASIVYIF